MALSTDKAPVYGGSTVIIEFKDPSPLTPDHTYFLVYEGTQQRHVTTARRLSPSKLHSIIPGHNQTEEVKVSVLAFSSSNSNTNKTSNTNSTSNKTILSTHQFHFVQDGAFYLAQFLVDSVFHPECLEDLELIKSDHFDLADEDVATLDQRLSRALAHLDFPDWWSLLGADADLETDVYKPRESLLHFAARLGLNRVAVFLIRKPGSQVILKLANRNGDLPRDVALANEHLGLAELLSDYNASGLMPLGHWFETEQGLVQTRETGDVTLTSRLDSHKRTIEEDIAVLGTIQRQLDDQEFSRSWQTPWPSTLGSDESSQENGHGDHNMITDNTYRSICEKSQNLPDLVTVESINSYHGQGGANGHPSVEGGSSEDIAMETSRTPNMQNSDLEEDMADIGVMEGSVSTVQEYNEHLLRIREKGTVFNKRLEQDLRKENLARFSSSCPSLDRTNRNSPLPIIDEADYSKSMVDLAEDNAQAAEDRSDPSPPYMGEIYTTDNGAAESQENVHIVVDGATTDSSTDFGLRTQEYDEFLTEFYGGNKPQVRRRSFSPVTVRSQSADEADDRSGSMLTHGNKSVSFGERDDYADEGIYHCRNDDEMTEQAPGAGTRQLTSSTHSDGDLDTLKDEEREGRVKGRGVNPARYSADIEYLMHQSKERNLEGLQNPSSPGGPYGDSQGLSIPHAKMTKALSTSSIPMATKADRQKGSHFKGYSQDHKHAQFHRQEEIEEEDVFDSSFQNVSPRRTRKKADMTLLDFLNDPSNFSNDSIQSPKVKDKEKEDKKRKPSMFSRFHSSYRQKKNKDKEGKHKSSTHRFVSVSFSNATTCDICHKPLTNKPALRCQICLVNLHDSACKEQISACEKFSAKGQSGRQASADTSMGYTEQDKSQSGGAPSSLRGTYSFKEKPTRTQSQFVGATTQPLPNLPPPTPQEKPPQEQSEVIMRPRTRRNALQSASAQLQRRSLPTPSRAIVEEEIEPSSSTRLDLVHTNITETNSQSVESLDEVDSTQLPEVGNEDIQLGDLDIDEPETWSETADKKTLKKMNPKDIKRQDTIWELIQTERQYCKRLKTLQLLYRNPMLHELGIPKGWVDRMFPQLDELTSIHLVFLHQLQELQSGRQDRSVDNIGHVLYDQFSGESSQQMKMAYGVFCSGHLEAVQLYKDFCAKDRKFQAFVKQRTNHRLLMKREIPDFILVITQRPTKYPILIEAIIKGTKDKKDREYLVKALELSKDVLHSVDEQVSAAERKMRLMDINNRLDKNSFAMRPGKKFRKQDILLNNRKLLHEGVIGLKSARGKSVDVLCVVLTDVLFFLQENNQKYSFFSPDNKYGVVPLYNLLVREKGDTKETKGMYLISQNKLKPEMYEVVFRSTADMNKWVHCVRAATENCPEEEEEGPAAPADEERLKAERRYERAQAIMDELRAKDAIIQQCCDVKNKLMVELLSVYSDTEDQQQDSRPSSRDFDETSVATSGGLQAVIQEVTQAASQLSNMLQGTSSNLSRSVSSVGEYTSANFTAVLVPKRAETFAGADNSHEAARPRKKPTDGIDFNDSPQTSMYKEGSDSDVSQHPDLPPLASSFETENDSGRGSSPGGVSSLSMLSPMSASTSSHDQLDIAKIVKTLNSIVYMISKQSTELESLRAQLVESNEKFNRLAADGHERKPGNKHNQLEELRNLQGVVQKEKEEWDKRKEKEKYAMEQERAQLEELRGSLSKQETDLKMQKEKLQRQIDLLRQHGQLPRDSVSSSQGTQEASSDKSDSVKVENSFVPGHRRSASAELVQNTDDQSKPSGPSPAVAGRPDRVPPVSKLSFSYGNKPNLPVHLLSATNEQKIGSKNVQQLPSKLLSTSSLSSGSSPPQQPPSHRHTQSPGNQAALISNVSSVSLGTQISGSHGDINKLGHSSSLGQLNSSGTSVSVPKGNWQSNRPPKQPGMAGLSGLMKLAEKGDKRGKGGSSQGGAEKEDQTTAQQRPKSGTPGQRNANINHKPQKSDSDVIYF